MGIELKVTTHPKFTVEELANQLADSLQTSANAQVDIQAFQEQIRTERKKIMENDMLVERIKEFRANPPAKISRMEPLMQYDLEEMENEIMLAKNNIADWEDLIKIASEKNLRNQKNTIRLHKEIAEQNSKK